MWQQTRNNCNFIKEIECNYEKHKHFGIQNDLEIKITLEVAAEIEIKIKEKMEYLGEILY